MFFLISFFISNADHKVSKQLMKMERIEDEIHTEDEDDVDDED